VRAPGPRTPSSPSLPTACIVRSGRFRIRSTREAVGFHTPDMRSKCLRFLGLGDRRGLGLLLSSWTRMHHDKTEGLLAYSPLTILHVDLADHTLPMPLAGLFLFATTRFLHQER
jgi:hypothetical protein